LSGSKRSRQKSGETSFDDKFSLSKYYLLDGNLVLATVSGSYGIAGTADCIIILTRAGRKETATLIITGRDIEDQERDLRFSDGKWELSENSNEAILSPLRQSIIDSINEDGPMTPTQVAKKLEKNVSTIKTTLARMAEGGLLVLENGVYSVPLDEIM